MGVCSSAEDPKPAVTDEMVRKALKEILQVLPHEWRGTTFNNSALLGRTVFSDRLCELILSKPNEFTTDDLVKVGNAEDYLRVASNVSTMLELALATEHGIPTNQVPFTQSNSYKDNVTALD